MNETEDEQVEALKKWWSENGRAIIFGVVIGGGAIFGWRFWQAHQLQQAEVASTAYQTIFSEFIDGNAEQVAIGENALRNDHSTTPYAALASLLTAKLAVDSNDLATAAESLRWAIDNSPEEDVRHIATLRLSRVLSAQGKNDDAFTLLDKTFPEAYAALIDELRGDILVAQGNSELAKAAYSRALDASQASQNTSVLQMKLDDLAGESQS